MDNQEKKVQEKVNKNKIKGSPIKNKKELVNKTMRLTSYSFTVILFQQYFLKA